MSTDADTVPAERIRLGVPVRDWRHALTVTGDLLTDAGLTTPQYTAEMIAAVEELGPYIVIAPGIALAHARPSDAVLGTGLSLITLRTPVAFGHDVNDPVSLVIGLCSTDTSSHLSRLRRVAAFLAEPGNVERVLAAGDADAVAASLNTDDRGEPT